MSFHVIDLFAKGGAFMWPLLFLSLVSLAIIVERLVFYTRHRYRVGASLEELRRANSSSVGCEDSRSVRFLQCSSPSSEATIKT